MTSEILLDEWNARYPTPGFVRDGILDPARWPGAGSGLAFLLKEAYGDPLKPEDWDLRTYLGTHWHRHAMWRTASQWAHVYQELPSSAATPHAQIKDALEPCEQALLSAAVINLKKFAGRSQSEKADLGQCVRRDGDLLQRQVDLINPRVLLCGMTWPLVRQLWPPAEPTRAQWVLRVGSMWVVDFWHPALRSGHAEKYQLLDQWLREAGVAGAGM